MRVCPLRELDQATAYAEAWDRLAGGMPMHTSAWCLTWWRHYGDADTANGRRRQLNVLGVFDEADQLVGLVPWYRQSTAVGGWTLRSLGDGEVCSDYPTILAQGGREEPVVAALAEYLHGTHAADEPDRWDMIELECVVDDDASPIARLADELDRLGHTIHRRPGPSVWRIPLPSSWDEYLALLSKDHRKRIRRQFRQTVDRGRAMLERVEHISQLNPAMDTLIELHQRRWQTAGEPGCFASAPYEAFHRELAEHMLRAGQLNLNILHLDGAAAAAEYHFNGGGIVYGYQAGADPDRRADQPGRLAQALMIHRSIRDGQTALDLLRGDEPYKPHWRAAPTATHHTRIVAPHGTAQWRHRLWLAGRGVRDRLRAVSG